jgi:muramoyltetrapeptide carboxypeptidase
VVRPVAPGSTPTIAVVSSASPAFDESLAKAGLEALQGAGFRLVRGLGIGRERGYLAGTPEERAADLHWAFTDPDIDVVMQIRGGYGCGQVVPLLDFELIATHPKPFVGMSDITLLHLALARHAGLVTLWGPNCVQLGRDAGGYSVAMLSSALRGEIAPVGRADGSSPIETLVPGKAEGPLAGGTTTLLAASLGTPYELETEGRVLLLEDVHVEPYEVDRCLTQLLHAGKLDVAAGFAIAEHSDVRTEESFGGHTLELAEVFEDILVPLGRPTVYGLPLGHRPRIATVPLGVNVQLDAESGTLSVLEDWLCPRTQGNRGRSVPPARSSRSP